MSDTTDVGRYDVLKQRLLTALDLPPDERESWLKGLAEREPAIASRVRQLLAAHAEAGETFLDVPATGSRGHEASENLGTPASTMAGQRIGPFLIEREIGQGGMGRVLLGTREEGGFTQRVAIKILQSVLGDPRAAERLIDERRILATLNHPNIAHFVDGGSTAEGLPYLAMEYVDGQPITTYCDGVGLTAHARIRLFLRVCDAVRFAHQRLVVHRDIKPSNILVTNEGVPKLLDFGIAKLIDPRDVGRSPTVRILTPHYASPEQVSGGAVTTATDVYSLGVLLFELLTGTSPYRGVSPESDPLTVMDAIRREPAERPSAAASRMARPAVDGDIDAILLKALRKEEGDRYGSVQQLAEDLARFLDGRPVEARAGSRAYLMRKFIGRHRGAVAATVAAALALAAGGATAAWQARIAGQERDRAQQRFDEARKLARTVLFEYSDGVLRLPGSVPVRRQMIEDSLEYLDRLSADPGNDNALQREIADAYQRAGEVQGWAGHPNLGDFAGALASHKKALAIRERLASREGGDPALVGALGRTYLLLGDAATRSGDIPGALEYFRKGFGVFERIPTKTPAMRKDLETLHSRFARAATLAGHLGDALASDTEALAIAEALVNESPTDRALRRDLCITHGMLGSSLLDAGRSAEAEAHFREALRIAEALVLPDDGPSRRDVGVARERLTTALRVLGRTREALELAVLALKDSLAVERQEPDNAEAKRDVQVDYGKVAQLMSAAGDVVGAMRHAHAAISYGTAAVQANPSSQDAKFLLAGDYFRLSEILEAQGQWMGALDSYRRTRASVEAIVASDAADARARGALAEVTIRIGEIEARRANLAAARSAFEQAREILEPLSSSNAEDVDTQTNLARALEGLGRVDARTARRLSRENDWHSARDAFVKSLAIWQALQQAKTLSPDFATRPAEVAAQLTQCDVAIAKLAQR